MRIELLRATQDDAVMLIEIQRKSFAALYKKYQDVETSPYDETLEHILNRMSQSTTIYLKSRLVMK